MRRSHYQSSKIKTRKRQDTIDYKISKFKSKNHDPLLCPKSKYVQTMRASKLVP